MSPRRRYSGEKHRESSLLTADENENDEEERVEFALDERWAKRFAETELKRRERRKAREREKREEQPVSGRVERARAKAEETMRTWEALE